MRFELNIGGTEKHKLGFRWNQMTGSLRISLDGSTLISRGVQLSSRNAASLPDVPDSEKWRVWGSEIELVQRWQLDVGTQETHHVRIEKERPTWLAGLRSHTYRVYVDGALVLSRRGY